MASPFTTRSSLPRKRRGLYFRLRTRSTGVQGRRRAALRVQQLGVRHQRLGLPREGRAAARAPIRATHERGKGRLSRKGTAHGCAGCLHEMLRDRQAKTKPDEGSFSGDAAHFLERHRHHKDTRNNHIAHSVNAFDINSSAAWIKGGVHRRARYATGRRDLHVQVLRCYR